MRSEVVIITACWQRPAVFRFFCQWYTQLQPRPVIVCAGSPGDCCEEIASEFGVVYEQVENVMGPKWNHACQMASKVRARYYLFMGSDDVMDRGMWSFYQEFNGQHLGLLDLFFYERASRSMAYWPGYKDARRKGEPIGACKLVSREVMDALQWAPFPDDRPNALDFDMHNRILALGVQPTVLPMGQAGGIAVDVKDAGSLTAFGRIMAQSGVRYVKAPNMERQSPELWNALLCIPRH